MQIEYTTKIIKVGNSLAVIIPKPLLKQLGWSVGDRISVDSGPNRSIVITRLEPNETLPSAQSAPVQPST